MTTEIKVKLGIPYCDFIGVKEVKLNLDTKLVAVHDIISELFRIYPDFKSKLAKNNLLLDSNLEALIVVNHKLLNNKKEWDEANIGNGSEIKVFMPFSGG